MKPIQRHNNKGFRLWIVKCLSRILRRIDRDCLVQPRMKVEFFDAIDIHGAYDISMVHPYDRPSQSQMDQAKDVINYRILNKLKQFITYKDRISFDGAIPCTKVIGTLWVVKDREEELQS